MKNSTTKRLSFIILVCITSVVIYITNTLHHYYSFAEENTISYHSHRQSNDTVKIIMIGDSWAAYHNQAGNDTILKNILGKAINKPVDVIASGMIGAKTKTIYKLMFDSISNRGTKKMLQKTPHYCIISAGINDAVAKMGPSNYTYHYDLIVKQLLTNNIIPIIIDMPDVDYKSVYQRETFFAKTRHRISCFLNNTDMWSFDKYRESLQNDITNKGNNKKVIFINAQDWNPKGFKDPRKLYQQDHIHLNQEGYHLLDSCIAAYIARDLTNHGYQLSH